MRTNTSKNAKFQRKFKDILFYIFDQAAVADNLLLKLIFSLSIAQNHILKHI